MKPSFQLTQQLGVAVLLLLVSHCVSANDELTIDYWYGDEQRFGHLGDSQSLVNVLGSVTPLEKVGDTWYHVNRQKRKPLRLGPDLHRLAQPGDFNIEIDRTALKPGKNSVVIGAHNRSGKFFSREVVVHYTPQTIWKLPYEVDFREIEHVQDAVEVIDGKWTLTEDGLRTSEPYYDRQIAFGDSSWTDYELQAEVLFHEHFPEIAGRNTLGPPYLSHVHTSFNLRWHGHPDDGFRPRRDWMNLGSLIALRCDLATRTRGSYWWLHFGRAIPGKPAKRSLIDQDNRHEIELGERYYYRMRAETLSNEQTRYSAKVWQIGDDEPAEWQMQGIDRSEALDSGSIIFVVHHSDVTLRKIAVEPLTRQPNSSESITE